MINQNMMQKNYLLIVLFAITILSSSCDKDEPSLPTRDYESNLYCHGYNAVDLGLSVPWSQFNWGAYELTQTGFFLVPEYWGYSKNFPSFISGTQWDRLHVKMGGDWRLPTREECIELRDLCQWSRCQLNGTEGVSVTGPNGKSLFFPITKYYYFYEIPWSDIDGPYEKYGEGSYGDLDQFCNGSFGLVIPYSTDGYCGYLRYDSYKEGGKDPEFELLKGEFINPLRAVYGPINSGGNNSGNGNGNNNTEKYEKPEVGFYDFTATRTSVTVTYRIYNKSECGTLTSAKIYYGTTSASKAITATISGIYIKVTITGLSAGTNYYVKCSVTGSAGTTTTEQAKVITNY